jgi:hypothetical protein
MLQKRQNTDPAARAPTLAARPDYSAVIAVILKKFYNIRNGCDCKTLVLALELSWARMAKKFISIKLSTS